MKKRTLVNIMSFLALLLLLSPAVSAAPPGQDNPPQPPGNPDPKSQLIDLQLLAFNDYHGHLEANTAGTVDGAAAGGSEYLSAKLNELRQGNKYSLTVAAGDLIGGSEALADYLAEQEKNAA